MPSRCTDDIYKYLDTFNLHFLSYWPYRFNHRNNCRFGGTGISSNDATDIHLQTPVSMEIFVTNTLLCVYYNATRDLIALSGTTR